MKKKQLKSRLNLNKVIVSRLSKDSVNHIVGGNQGHTDDHTVCDCDLPDTDCRICKSDRNCHGGSSE